MEILDRDRIEREGLPQRAHILELVSDRSECQRHPHFPGMGCVPLSDIKRVREDYDPTDPIVIHCDRPERCTLAAEELARLGFSSVIEYRGELRDLEGWVRRSAPWGKREAAATTTTGVAGGVGEEEAPSARAAEGEGELVERPKGPEVTPVGEMEGPGVFTRGPEAEAEAGFEPPEMGSAELESLLKARGQNVKLLNLVGEESKCERVLGVKCLEPWGLEETLKRVNRDDAVVFHCEEGIDHRTIAKALHEMGFRDVGLYRGDFAQISWLSRI